MSEPVGQNRDWDRLIELFSALADERLTNEQTEMLVSLLMEDEQARALYLEFAAMQALLPRETQEGGPPPFVPGLGLSETGLDEGEPQAPGGKSPILGFLGECFDKGSGFFGGAFRLGGVLVLLVGAFLIGSMLSDWRGGPGSSQVADETEAARLGPVVGRFVRAVDAGWNNPATAPSPGDPLPAGTVLELWRGVVEIAFDCGATVVLRGPASFELSSPLAGRLSRGRLSVTTPEEAFGFVVETPSASFVDLGTEFSVDVNAKGGANAFVHEGEIRLGVVESEASESTSRRFSKGEGVRVELGPGGQVVLTETPAGTELAPLRLERLSTVTPERIGGLRLWLKADAGTFRDTEGTQPAEPGDRVACWSDQSGNGMSPLQPIVGHRPKLAVDSAGRLVLRFDGVSQRLEQPNITGPTSQVLEPFDRGVTTRFTVCLVFTAARTHVPEGQTFFGQFAVNPRVTDSSRLLGIDRGGQFIYDEWPPGAMYLRSSEDSILPGQTYMVVVTRNGSHRSIHFGGKLIVSDNQAEIYAGNEPCLWWIGGRFALGKPTQFFQGDIAELVIFTRALSDDVRGSVEAYLARKYL